MSQMGQNRSFGDFGSMSASVHFADSSGTSHEVREVPIADIASKPTRRRPSADARASRRRLLEQFRPRVGSRTEHEAKFFGTEPVSRKKGSKPRREGPTCARTLRGRTFGSHST